MYNVVMVGYLLCRVPLAGGADELFLKIALFKDAQVKYDIASQSPPIKDILLGY